MKESYQDIFNTNPRYSTTIGFILGLILISDLTAPEQNMLGNWVVLIGQTILTNAASQNIIESRISGSIFNINSKKVKAIYDPPVYDIKKIREIIKQIFPESTEDVHQLSKVIENLQNQINELKKND